MLQTFLHRAGWFFLLLALQVLIFNHIHIAGYAVPMPYVYFLLILSSETPRRTYLVASFAMGLAIDLFINTPGLCAASLCLCGLVAPWLLSLFRHGEKDDDDFFPSVRTMKWSGFMLYALALTFLHCLTLFTIEYFSISHSGLLLINVASSTTLTLIIIAILEFIRHGGRAQED